MGTTADATPCPYCRGTGVEPDGSAAGAHGDGDGEIARRVALVERRRQEVTERMGDVRGAAARLDAACAAFAPRAVTDAELAARWNAFIATKDAFVGSVDHAASEWNAAFAQLRSVSQALARGPVDADTLQAKLDHVTADGEIAEAYHAGVVRSAEPMAAAVTGMVEYLETCGPDGEVLRTWLYVGEASGVLIGTVESSIEAWKALRDTAAHAVSAMRD